MCPQKACKIRLTECEKEEIEYLLYTPNNYHDKAQTKFPLIVFLHGAYEKGNDVNILRTNALPLLLEFDENFPFIVVSPQCSIEEWWVPDIVIAFLNAVQFTPKVDFQRIYLTGLSMGGFGTWHTAAAYPSRFAAIAPICGGGYPFSAKKLINLPVWAFHGAKDKVIPVQRSEEMVEAIIKCGGNAKLTIYPDSEHDSWTETYKNKELYEWFLNYKIL